MGAILFDGSYGKDTVDRERAAADEATLDNRVARLEAIRDNMVLLLLGNCVLLVDMILLMVKARIIENDPNRCRWQFVDRNLSLTRAMRTQNVNGKTILHVARNDRNDPHSHAN